MEAQKANQKAVQEHQQAQQREEQKSNEKEEIGSSQCPVLSQGLYSYGVDYPSLDAIDL
jgi:hypothetical protein